MTDSETIIKGELHSSRHDLNETISLLEDGVDHLIIEDSEQKAEYPRRHLWFKLQMWLLTHFFFKRLYTDHTILEDIADGQDANVIKTRRSNSELIDNASRTDIATGFLVFITFTIGGVLMGFLTSGWWMFIGGVAAFTLGMIAPPLLLRMEESEREVDNRDELIAEKITSAAETGGRVVAVVGEHHRQLVVKNLPEWIDADPRPRAYGWYHPRMLLKIGMALVVLLTLYGALYVILLFSLEFAIGIV